MNIQHRLKAAASIRYVLLLAFIIRSIVPIIAFIVTKDHRIFYSPDTGSYIRFATKLLLPYKGTPEIVRTPGYPILLLPGILSGNTELITIFLQIILNCLTVYLIFRIALLLFKRVEIAMFCSVMYAVEPLSVLYAGKLLTESLFTSAITLFLYCLLKYLKDRAIYPLLVSSIALAASVYIRPISYFLPVFITGILLVWIFTKMQRDTRLILHVCVFLLLSSGLIGLWQLRNKIETGYSGFSAITDINLYFYQGASVLAAKQGISYYEMQDRMGYHDTETYLSNHPDQVEWSQNKKYEYMRKEGIKIVINNPFVYSTIHLKGMFRTLFDPGAIEYLKMFRLYPESGGLLGVIIDKGLVRTLIHLIRERPLIFWSNLLLGLIAALYLLLGLIALLSKNFTNNMPMITVLSVGTYFLIMSGGPNSLARFRHPIMPIICILAGYGFFVITTKLNNRGGTTMSK
ncbi:MAG: ArnT family glycosyltransferase [Thermodesulfobacteriota bacterium]